MSLTTIVGALVALVARPKAAARLERRQRTKKPYVSKDPLIAFTAMLERGIARRDGEIETLERELNLTQQALEHWRGEAARLARENRERRAYDMMQAAMAQQAQQGQQQQNTLNDQQHAYQGFCNCTPSRSQVWGAQHGLVQQLNDNGRE